MQTCSCEHTLKPMETYHFEQEPPLSWSLNGGEASAPIHQQPREDRKRGGKRGPAGIKLSTDPQSVAARERRHRISDRFRILKSLVPGGRKMDTVSMLEEAIHYVQFLKTQIVLHQAYSMILPPDDAPYLPFPSSSCMYTDIGCPSSPHRAISFSPVEMPPPLPTFSNCSLPPPPSSPLPPFPVCSFFDGEEMMIPQYGFN